jgi:hypothetical protein
MFILWAFLEIKVKKKKGRWSSCQVVDKTKREKKRLNVSRQSGWRLVWVTLTVGRHRATKSPPFLFRSCFFFLSFSVPPVPARSVSTPRPNPPFCFLPPLVIVVAPAVESPVPPSAVAGYYCWLASKIAKETTRSWRVLLFPTLRVSNQLIRFGWFSQKMENGETGWLIGNNFLPREIHLLCTYTVCACVPFRVEQTTPFSVTLGRNAAVTALVVPSYRFPDFYPTSPALSRRSDNARVDCNSVLYWITRKVLVCQ